MGFISVLFIGSYDDGGFMKYMMRSFAPFLCGGVFVANLSLLIGTNPNYEASWFNVVIALLVAIFAPVFWGEE